LYYISIETQPMLLSSEYNKFFSNFQIVKPEKVVFANISIRLFIKKIVDINYWNNNNKVSLTNSDFDWNSATAISIYTDMVQSLNDYPPFGKTNVKSKITSSKGKVTRKQKIDSF
jgi:hypothetical protein